MVRLTEALAKIADHARLNGDALPTISMPPAALISLSQSIEGDLGGRLYDFYRSRGFQYDGISFIPRPRIRVKAGRRVIRKVPLERPEMVSHCGLGPWVA